MQVVPAQRLASRNGHARVQTRSTRGQPPRTAADFVLASHPLPGVGGIESHRGGVGCARRSVALGTTVVRAAARLLQVHALFALSLLVGLVVPLAPLTPPAAAALSQGSPLPPPLPAPVRVALSGSFQTALGCPADFDPTCPQTQLQDNRDGSWSAVLPVPPGDYVFRVVASSDAERALGQGGDPNGADIPLSVPGDAAGVYFRYDSLTGEIVAEPVANAATLVTDLGEQFAMAPARGGGYEVTWDAQPGSYGFQVLFNGQPVAQDSVSLDSPSRVIVAVDEAGAVTVKDTLRDTRLDVTATDASGAPRPGSCFAIIDREGELRTQGCDADDGQLDGLLRLRVPNGLDDGNYTLRETLTAGGRDACRGSTHRARRRAVRSICLHQRRSTAA